MPAASTIERAQDLIKARLGEIEEECKSLERALGELGHKIRPGRVQARRGRPRRRSSGDKPGSRRPRKSGGRSEEAVALVGRSPGITAGEVASVMKINPNYVYRVLGDLGKEGRVKKDGRQYFPVD